MLERIALFGAVRSLTVGLASASFVWFVWFETALARRWRRRNIATSWRDIAVAKAGVQGH